MWMHARGCLHNPNDRLVLAGSSNYRSVIGRNHNAENSLHALTSSRCNGSKDAD